MTDRRDVLKQIDDERERQEQLRRSGKFKWTCASEESHPRKLAVLAEEFGEVAKEVTEELIAQDKGLVTGEIRRKLRTELVQTAAVIVAWLEAL